MFRGKIVVLDDHKNMLTLFQRLFEFETQKRRIEAINAFATANPEEALKHVNEHNERVTLIIIDGSIENKPEIMRRMRKVASHALILISTNNPDTVHKLIEAGADLYMEKTKTVDFVRDLIDRHDRRAKILHS